ncbi:hypothetical protein PPL_03914 [Heterostelium album PN500]|uniref:Uncharacterized protein n=1 Tax=Heterostelium pallidum (strain ATCC 26659 / Pp 5 / PN500) TaxID=670386 RepID=D3B5H6_HETP5|nr:hypothetical protein PPL_03914 [Heterostelium album PN500]EFA83124.1 hypothetical protein PPL_03914 [Heterostelium album PN500]|eukprot:XP_020435241.1 hypothetical protein PPL_03914 [Heterostelium album PN500]
MSSAPIKLGGKFLDDFQAWRDAKIAAQFPNIPTLSPDTLTPQNFLAISTFDPNSKVDIVKDRAEKYFTDLLNFSIGMFPGVLSDDLKELLADEKSAEFYSDYSKMWFIQTIYHTDATLEYKSTIRCGRLEREINDIAYSATLAKQTMMIYYIALKELVPQILPFIYHRNTFNPKLRAFMLEAVQNQQMAFNALKSHVANVNVPGEYDQFRFNELKSKLDLLNPTYKLSNDILSSYVFGGMAYYISGNIRNCPSVKSIYYNTILKVLKRIRKNPTNKYNEMVGLITNTQAGDVVKASTVISQMFNKVTLEPLNAFKNINTLQFLTKATVLPFKATNVDPAFNDLKANAVFLQFINALYCACVMGTIAYGLFNQSLEVFDLSVLYAGSALFVDEYVQAVAQNRIFQRMGEFIRDFTKKINDPVKVANAFQNMIPHFIDKAAQDLISNMIPMVFMISKDAVSFNVFTNVKKRKSGSLSITISNIDKRLVSPVMTILRGSSFSSTYALYLGGAMFGLSLRKYMNQSLIGYITLRNMVRASNPNAPDQLANYIETIPSYYRVDYDNETEEFDDRADWESFYEISENDYQKALDLLVNIPKTVVA